jgi:hypothetical protein
MAQDNKDPGKILPPYLPFKTFQAAIQNLRVHGLPSLIDRSTFNSRSGLEQTQILGAFRFLGLIDEHSKTQQSLRTLVGMAANSDLEKKMLAEVMRDSYVTLFTLDLPNTTPGALENAMGGYGVTGTTRDRAVRFFIKAAQYANIKLSTRLTRDLRTRESSADDATDAEESAPKQNGAKTRKRKKQTSPQLPAIDSGAAGQAMKTIQLPIAGGTLTVSGTFNPFDLIGLERKLVYDIIDKMNEFESTGKEGENAATNTEK